MNEKERDQAKIRGLMKRVAETPLKRNKPLRLALFKNLIDYREKYQEEFPVEEGYEK